MANARAVVVSSLLVWTVAGPAWAVGFTPNAPGVNGFTRVDTVTWVDSRGLVREFFFAKEYPNPIPPTIQGYVTRLTWKPDQASPRIVAEEDPVGINKANSQGWGINVMHMHWKQYGGANPYFGAGYSATTTKRDGFDFQQGPLFLGPHHLIFRVTYKQYTTLQVPGVARKWVKVTTDWFFADGQDSVIYAITLDAAPGYLSDPVAFLNNTLAPYSLLTPASWKGTTDWAGGTGAPDGQSWGDFKRFVTTDMQRWTYGGTNTIPYVWMWVSPASRRGDAEGAYVQTETWAQKRAGEGFAGGQDATGTRLPVYPDLNGEEYAYQLNFFDSYGSKRLTWGLQPGAFYGGFGSSPGYINYSLAMYLGKYSGAGVPALIQETEAIHDGTLAVQATVGALVSVGPEGSGNATPRTYSPRGYNHVYRTWEVQADANRARLRFDAGAVPFTAPVFVVHGYTASSLAVTVNGAPAASSVSYRASPPAAFVTLLATLSGNNVIDFAAPGAGVDPDGDGVASLVDNCPTVANPSQADADGDGIGDACDVAVDAGLPPALDAGTRADAGSPLDAGTAADAGVRPDAGAPVDAGLACVLGDGDRDGVCDDRDNCRDCANASQADADGDGLGDCWRCDWCNGPGTDTDWDGRCDGVDNCAQAWNQSQRDSDGDGVGDVCDNCPMVANASQVDVDGDGLGDACDAVIARDAGSACALGDQDFDGVCDDWDNCRGCANPAQVDADGDGLGDCWACDWCNGPGTDTDWDGFCDGADNCPRDWNQSQRDSDRDGVGDVCD